MAAGKSIPSPRSLSQFLKPGLRIRAVYHASQIAQPLRRVVAVSPNVVLRDFGVQGKKAIHGPGLGEDISGMAKLRRFDDDGFFNVKDVFIPKQIDPACAA